MPIHSLPQQQQQAPAHDATNCNMNVNPVCETDSQLRIVEWFAVGLPLVFVPPLFPACSADFCYSAHIIRIFACLIEHLCHNCCNPAAVARRFALASTLHGQMAAACTYCGLADPACLVWSPFADLWYCNSQFDAHIYHHLQQTRSRRIGLRRPDRFGLACLALRTPPWFSHCLFSVLMLCCVPSCALSSAARTQRHCAARRPAATATTCTPWALRLATAAHCHRYTASLISLRSSGRRRGRPSSKSMRCTLRWSLCRRSPSVPPHDPSRKAR